METDYEAINAEILGMSYDQIFSVEDSPEILDKLEKFVWGYTLWVDNYEKETILRILSSEGDIPYNGRKAQHVLHRISTNVLVEDKVIEEGVVKLTNPWMDHIIGFMVDGENITPQTLQYTNTHFLNGTLRDHDLYIPTLVRMHREKNIGSTVKVSGGGLRFSNCIKFEEGEEPTTPTGHSITGYGQFESMRNHYEETGTNYVQTSNCSCGILREVETGRIVIVDCYGSESINGYYEEYDILYHTPDGYECLGVIDCGVWRVSFQPLDKGYPTTGEVVEVDGMEDGEYEVTAKVVDEWRDSNVGVERIGPFVVYGYITRKG